MSAKASAKTNKKTKGAKAVKKAAPAKAAKTTKAGKKQAPKAKAGVAPKPAAPKAKAARAKPTAKAKAPPAKKPPARKPAFAKPAKPVPAASKSAIAATKRRPGKPKAARPAAKASSRRKSAASATGKLRARVLVYPRREILDPQGRAIRNALAGIGFDQVEDVRAGKSFEIILSARAARATGAAGGPLELLTAMCERLLANSVVEDFAIELSEEAAGEQDGKGVPPA